MGKEYDLINELGPQNWLDVIAGEAVVLGHKMNNPELVLSGTSLATLLREIKYDHDDFEKVIAWGVKLSRQIEQIRDCTKVEFIDDLFVGLEKNKSCIDWEYSFSRVEDRYWIMMILPEYYGFPKADRVRIEIEKRVRGAFDDPSFESYQNILDQKNNDSQTLSSTVYLDKGGREIKRVTDWNHEGETKRGCVEIYYFDDYEKATEVWRGVKDIFISGQKR